ncbi:DUF2486 family protein [Futiania mangrovi]|uniref:DUF2486 family protein n=1 Tax=Futiania mangrovi TaxID=2959716 RepID=UPI0038B2974C
MFLSSPDAQPLPLFQDVARGHPPRGDDVRPVSAFSEERRGPAARKGHRHQPRSGAVLVEQVRTDVCWRHPQEAGRQETGRWLNNRPEPPPSTRGVNSVRPDSPLPCAN